MTIRHCLFICLLAQFSFTGCVGFRDTELGTPEAWLTQSPIDEFIDAKEENVISSSDVYEIPLKNIRQAENLLENVRLTEIRTAKAKQLLGKHVLRKDGCRLFLVRGVVQNRQNGVFQCVFFRGRLEVAYGTMGTREYPIHRQPLIIQLPDKPKEVYITCSIME